ncbi:endonuclease/exonuclease/phosphatase family protein [Rosistilla oblonga]|uniref:endonuclease/exonuclease/phosphatase family protein n=1 Tax=Rosistilla oblonga TaxID=2527990 RepID=UPI003A973A77
MNISRRHFSAAIAAAGLSTTTTTPGFADAPKPAPLRVISYNVLVCRGWPKTRRLAKLAVKKGQMADRLALELALHEPDVVNFSESPSEAITQAVAEKLRMHHVRFPSGGNWPGTLLSRFPIAHSQNAPLGGPRPKDLYTRHWGRAELQMPSGDPLIVHSAHLFPGADPAVRLKEIRTMLKSMKSDFDAGRSMLLIGDLNHGPDTDEYKLWIDAGWIDTFAAVGKGEGLTFTADNPRYRIDYVMAAGPIAQRITESRPLLEGAFRVDSQDPESFALSDHIPQLAVFGGKQ